MLSALLRTRSTAHALLHRTACHVAPTRQAPSALPDVVLPSPEDITRKLVVLGIEDGSARHISSTMMNAALLLKKDFEGGIRRMLQAPTHPSLHTNPARISSTFTTIYQSMIDGWADHILNVILPRAITAQRRLEQRREVCVSGDVPQRKVFNQGAIPTLERFFEENAFPSRLEKHELATTWGMDYKQIHVWFQNRRSRSRKEGKELKRPTSQVPLLEELEKSVIETLLPSSSEDEDAVSIDSDDLYLLNADTPAHAFPTPYPPLCSYDPFPSEPEKRALMLPWLRSSGSSVSTRKAVEHVDVDQLVTAFAHMTLSCEESSAPVPSRSSRFFLGFDMPCMPAPLPALIHRTGGSPRYGCLVEQPSHSISSSSLSSSSSPSQGNVFTPPIRTPNSFGPFPEQRVKRTLPRRVPKHPPTSQILRQSPQRPSRSSSISSLRSSPDSPLATPPSLPIVLPLVPERCSIALASDTIPPSDVLPTLQDILRWNIAADSLWLSDKHQQLPLLTSIPVDLVR